MSVGLESQPGRAAAILPRASIRTSYKLAKSISPQVLGVTSFFLLVAALLTYLAFNLPVHAPYLPLHEARAHWPAAAAAGAFVALVDGLLIAFLARRDSLPAGGKVTMRSTAAHGPLGVWGLRLPAALGPERVPGRVILITAAASSALLFTGALKGFPLWTLGMFATVPWIVPLFVEALWKYEHYGFYAIFLCIAVLQAGHLGEHTVQVIQLLLTGGDLVRSHRVFGQLDLESVHFFWDTSIWLGTGALIYKFGRGNLCLWLSFAFASLHAVEHIYLFWLSRTDLFFYLRGGYAGIFGEGGVIGSPLARPYLHFAYNFCVVATMLVALWEQTKHVQDRARRVSSGLEKMCAANRPRPASQDQ